MGNSNNTSDKISGLNSHCYNTGFDHGSMSLHSDIVGDAISAGPCTINDSANQSYARGYMDGMKTSGTSGVSAGENNETPSITFNNGAPYRKKNNLVYVFKDGIESTFTGSYYVKTPTPRHLQFKDGYYYAWSDPNGNMWDKYGDGLWGEDPSTGESGQ